MDWISHIRRYSTALAEAAERVEPTTPVPTCGDWTMADLVWHLLEVQDFWTYIIANRPVGPDAYQERVRPDDPELVPGLLAASDGLVAALVGADTAAPAWSWSAEQTVGFTLRRQAHEAFVHMADGLLAAGAPLPDVEPRFAADGVDEMLTVMLAGVPDWASFTPDSDVVQLRCTDTGDTWTRTFGQMRGTSPGTGTTYDELALAATDGEANAVISANAVELDLWLWRRLPSTAVELSGDHRVAERLLEAAIIT